MFDLNVLSMGSMPLILMLTYEIHVFGCLGKTLKIVPLYVRLECVKHAANVFFLVFFSPFFFINQTLFFVFVVHAQSWFGVSFVLVMSSCDLGLLIFYIFFVFVFVLFFICQFCVKLFMFRRLSRREYEMNQK